eukprot:403333968
MHLKLQNSSKLKQKAQQFFPQQISETYTPSSNKKYSMFHTQTINGTPAKKSQTTSKPNSIYTTINQSSPIKKVQSIKQASSLNSNIQRINQSVKVSRQQSISKGLDGRFLSSGNCEDIDLLGPIIRYQSNEKIGSLFGSMHLDDKQSSQNESRNYEKKGFDPIKSSFRDSIISRNQSRGGDSRLSSSIISNEGKTISQQMKSNQSFMKTTIGVTKPTYTINTVESQKSLDLQAHLELYANSAKKLHDQMSAKSNRLSLRQETVKKPTINTEKNQKTAYKTSIKPKVTIVEKPNMKKQTNKVINESLNSQSPQRIATLRGDSRGRNEVKQFDSFVKPLSKVEEASQAIQNSKRSGQINSSMSRTQKLHDFEVTNKKPSTRQNSLQSSRCNSILKTGRKVQDSPKPAIKREQEILKVLEQKIARNEESRQDSLARKPLVIPRQNNTFEKMNARHSIQPKQPKSSPLMFKTDPRVQAEFINSSHLQDTNVSLHAPNNLTLSNYDSKLNSGQSSRQGIICLDSRRSSQQTNSKKQLQIMVQDQNIINSSQIQKVKASITKPKQLNLYDTRMNKETLSNQMQILSADYQDSVVLTYPQVEIVNDFKITCQNSLVPSFKTSSLISDGSPIIQRLSNIPIPETQEHKLHILKSTVNKKFIQKPPVKKIHQKKRSSVDIQTEQDEQDKIQVVETQIRMNTQEDMQLEKQESLLTFYKMMQNSSLDEQSMLKIISKSNQSSQLFSNLPVYMQLPHNLDLVDAINQFQKYSNNVILFNDPKKLPLKKSKFSQLNKSRVSDTESQNIEKFQNWLSNHLFQQPTHQELEYVKQKLQNQQDSRDKTRLHHGKQ